MKHGESVSVTARQQTYCEAILNKMVARFLLHQFRERQNYGMIQLQGTAGETLAREPKMILA